MNLEQTTALLAYASAIDPRIRRNDPVERQLQVRAWHAQLARIEPQDAAGAVDEHYSRPGADAALPGDIAGRARAVATARRRTNLERAGDAALLPVGVDPDDVGAWLAALRERRDQIAEGAAVPELEAPNVADVRMRDLRLEGVFRRVPRADAGGAA